MRSKFYLGAVMLLWITGAAFAQADPQTSTQNTKQGNTRVNNADQRFVTEAAEGGTAEVAHGQLAVARTKNQDVKVFAQRLVDDHTKANQELMQLASSKGIKLPDPKMNKTTPPTNNTGMTDEQRQLTGKHRDMQDKLSKLSDADFDREYIRHQLMEHEKAVELFERQAKNGTDAELKAFAEKTLPSLREHLQSARTLAPKVGIPEGKASRSGK